MVLVFLLVNYLLIKSTKILLTESFLRYDAPLYSEDILWENLVVIRQRNGDLLLKDKTSNPLASLFRHNQKMIEYKEFEDFDELSRLLKGGKAAVQKELAKAQSNPE